MRIKINFLILLLFFWGSASAQEKAPIQLQAERGSYDGQKGIATYEGNVVIQQGEMELRGDVVRLYFKENKVVRVEAMGKPARFHYQPKSAPTIVGEGQQMEYEVSSQMIQVKGEAYIKQGKNELRAANLNYDLRKEYVKSQRVKVIFHPEN